MALIEMVPVDVDGARAVGITVELPGTRLLVLSGRKGYLMCGALDVALLDSPRLAPRQIVAGRAVGVRTLHELLEAPLESVTSAARALGLREGMRASDALALLA